MVDGLSRQPSRSIRSSEGILGCHHRPELVAAEPAMQIGSLAVADPGPRELHLLVIRGSAWCSHRGESEPPAIIDPELPTGGGEDANRLTFVPLEVTLSEQPELIYVGDPMCSWCWGVSSAVDYLARRSDIRFRLVLGGLRVGTRVKRLDEVLRVAMTNGWEKVAAKSGQPFDTAFLQRDEWEFNSELPSIAVAAMRELAPHQTLSFFRHLQGSFYRDGVDITDRAVYPELIVSFPVEPAQFLDVIDSDRGRARARDDFAERREMGVEVLPTVLLDTEGKLQTLATGYFDRDYMENQLTYWVEGRQPSSASVGVCSLDGSTC